jgi:hypothetical protein
MTEFVPGAAWDLLWRDRNQQDAAAAYTSGISVSPSQTVNVT